ncbi:MAG: tetratricopeptide repeat protein [Alphaproteobacteria bacterium]|nr:tetratricopeptide repeat protein [Alphaproteobacteria bacterium]
MAAANQESTLSDDRPAGRSPARTHWSNLLALGDEAITDGRLADAFEHCKNALRIAKESGPGSDWLAESYVRLADICAALDRQNAALRLYGRGVAILNRLPNGVSVLLAHAVSNMGRLRMLNGETATAVELTAAADALQRKLNAPESPAIKLNLALVEATAGRDRDADEAFRDVLAATDRCRGTGGALVFAVHDNFARFCIWRGRKADAEMALRSCLILRQEAGGPRHPVYADGLVNLARMHLLYDAEDEAESLLWQAADVYRHNGDAPAAALVEAIYLLARIAQQGERADEAGALCNQLFTLGEENTSATAAAQAAALHIGARLRLAGPDRMAAETPMRQALGLAGGLRGDFRRLGNDISGDLLRELSDLLVEIGKDAEAERLIARADELRGQPQWGVTGFVFADP